jgi:DNA-binding response OmpR family regulator
MIAGARSLRAVVLGQLERPRGALDLLEEIRHGCRGLQSQSAWEKHLPTIMLGSGDAQLELLRAFEAGADDYIQCPVSYLELRARLKALLRRAESTPGARVLRVGALEIDTAAHAVRFGATQIELCRLEYELLAHLARNPTAVHSKQELLGAIWKRRTSAGTRTVDSHASRARRKLDGAGAEGFVVNVWGVGYRLI